VFEILSSKILQSRSWPFGFTWRHRSRDHWTRSVRFPIVVNMNQRCILHGCWDIELEGLCDSPNTEGVGSNLQYRQPLICHIDMQHLLIKVKVKVGYLLYSAAYTWTRDQKRFTISEVAADWHELMIPRCIMWPSIAHASEQLDLWCSTTQTYHRPNQPH